MIVDTFQVTDLLNIHVQEAQRSALQHLDLELAKTLEGADAFTVRHNGEIMLCGGFAQFYPGRGECWSFMSRYAGGHMVGVFRVVKTYIEMLTCRRVEMTVDCEFEPGHRLARMLGFQLEAPQMRAYDMFGRDRSLYARVKNG